MSGFGAALKNWRGRRRMSQLGLSGAANVSARHIAFLETGRARPSRTMVLQLSEALAIPRAERNALLNAAGYSPAYVGRNINDAEMAEVRTAVAHILKGHGPYPALTMDRHWRLLSANTVAMRLLGQMGLGEGDSLLAAFAGDSALWAAIDNKAETAQHLVTRLRTESAHLGGDAVLDDAAQRIAARVRPSAWDHQGPLPPVVPTRIRTGDAVLSLFSTIAQFGTAEDLALADLRIELFFPADQATRMMLENLAG